MNAELIENLAEKLGLYAEKTIRQTQMMGWLKLGLCGVIWVFLTIGALVILYALWQGLQRDKEKGLLYNFFKPEATVVALSWLAFTAITIVIAVNSFGQVIAPLLYLLGK